MDPGCNCKMVITPFRSILKGPPMTENDGRNASTAVAGPTATQSAGAKRPKKRVRFAKSTHGEDEVYRDSSLYDRSEKTYIPGKHADTSGRSWMNTSGFGMADPWRREHLDVRARNANIFAPHFFKCPRCNVEFRTSGELQDHKEDAHNETFSCVQCSKAFPTFNELNAHIPVAHPFFEEDTDDMVID